MIWGVIRIHMHLQAKMLNIQRDKKTYEKWTTGTQRDPENIDPRGMSSPRGLQYS